MKFGIKAKTLILIAGSAILFYSTVTTVGGNFLKNSFLETKAKHLINIRDMQAILISEYLEELKNQVSFLSATPTMITASREFIDAFDTVLASKVPFQAKDKLLQYYQVLADSINKTSEKKIAPGDLLMDQDNRALLQANYFLDGKIDLEQPSEIERYVQAHDKYHQFFRQTLKTFHYYDILIIDKETGNIVYSTSKEADFATNIHDGPFKGSNLSSLIMKITEQAPTYGTRGQITDFNNYLPSFNNPASFIAHPINSNGETIAYLAVQISISRINEIMLFKKQWQQVGLGHTGETYLYGSDSLLRSDSRDFIEKRGQIGSITARKNGSHTIMEQKVTSIIQEPIGDPSNQVYVSKDGDSLKLSAYRKLEGQDLDWYIMAEMELQEILKPVEQIKAKAFLMIFVVISIFTIVLIGVTTIFVNRILHFNQRAEEISKGNLDVRAEISSKDEMGNLASTFNRMVTALKKERSLNKKKQSELEQANHKLEETYSQLLISEKMATIGGLLAGVAHEINNPLNYIHNGTSALKEIAGEISGSFQKFNKEGKIDNEECDHNINWLLKMVETIDNGTNRVMEIVGSLLMFGREKQDELSEIEITKTLNSALILFENKTKYTINVLKRFDAVPSVFGNPGKLNQVFVNLIGNAIQAIEEKYGTEVKPEKEGLLLLSTRVHENKKHIVITVADNGPGVPEEIRNKIFDPFFTTKETGKGTGLGLSITYSIIEAHNGNIKIRNGTEDINGISQSLTRFDVYLPIERAKDDGMTPPHQ